MKQRFNYLIVFIFCLVLTSLAAKDLHNSGESTHSSSTEIVLDSIQNTVYIAYENGYPAYYYSHIFTPVCNTGECLPVFVNLYWDLSGRYLRFDQPTGEILTKLDHVPFSAEDYRLLDEILQGSDPRYGDYSKHSPGNPKDQDQKGNNQTNPAPSIESRKMISKYDMIDGITGATAIQHKASFVPGALYTTYTLWGLANDFREEMLAYTRIHFFANTYYNYFLLHPEWPTFTILLEKLYAEKIEPNGRTNTLMTILDTCSVEKIQTNVLSNVHYDDFRLDTVCHTLERIFFRPSGNELSRLILARWTYFIPDPTFVRLSKSIHLYPDLFLEMTKVFTYRPNWPTGTVENLINCMPALTETQRTDLIVLLESKKAILSKDDRSKIKDAKKKYN